MSRRDNLKKIAKVIQSKGRFGDTELVHINKDEEKILENYRGSKLSRNPKTGVKEAFPWAYAAYQAGRVGHGAFKAKKQRDYEKKRIKKQKRMDTEALTESISAAKQISPQEAQAMANLRQGAEQGTMDVEGLNRQMSQPIYQQGQAQQAQAMGNITAQGLEGSIIAQETSRKIGSDVRAEIANQARNIAMQNEQTKAQAKQSLQSALFKRGELLRNLAIQKAEGLSSIKREASFAQQDSEFAHQAARRQSYGDLMQLAGQGIGQSLFESDEKDYKHFKDFDITQWNPTKIG